MAVRKKPAPPRGGRARKKPRGKKPRKAAAPKTPERQAIEAWRAKAVRLFIRGWTYAEIARHLGKLQVTVRKGIEAELAETTENYAERVKERKALKSAQLDAIIRGNLREATRGPHKSPAAFVVIAAIDKQMKLYGLAAAEKVDVNAKLSLSFDSAQELMKRIARLKKKQTDARDDSGTRDPGDDPDASGDAGG